MIYTKFPSKHKPPKLYELTRFQKPSVPHSGPGMYAESQRREAVIKKHFKECPYYANEMVRKAGDTAEERTIKVLFICPSYAAYDKADWPANDNPLIVYAQYANGDKFFCTTNFLEK